MRRFIGLMLFIMVTGGCAFISVPLPLSRQAKMQEFVTQPPKHFYVIDKVLLLDISGEITGEASSGLLSERASTLADVRDALDKAEKDEHVKAIVLRINSPGGEVTASDAIYEQIKRFKKKRADEKRPVVILASILSAGASGAYYLAVAADKIYAHPTAITGSIGVIAMFPELAGLTRKIGVDVRVIKSAEHKDLGSMWRDWTPAEQKILQEMVTDLYDRFVGIVAENRPGLDRDKVRALADGRVYTAKQAVENHLIDEIAYLDDVIEKAKKQAGVPNAAVVTYRRAQEFQGGIYSRSAVAAPQAPPQLNLLQINADRALSPWRQPGFYYLWMP